jgi:dTDP-4-dehydrorhamnose 3,5-epimerase
MTIQETALRDCFIIQPKIFQDSRGYFFESFNEKIFHETIGSIQFVQDNEALSHKGILRGLHWQNGEHAQAKLVRVQQGKVLDVVVDMRKDSSTYLQHISIELSGHNKTQLFIPRGFAHGYTVLEDNTVFCYKCDNFYHPSAEGGLRYNDPTLNIDWKINAADIVLSDKDAQLPFVH